MMTGIPIILIIIGLVVIFLGPILGTITFPVSKTNENQTKLKDGIDSGLREIKNERKNLVDNNAESYFQLFGMAIFLWGIGDLGRRLRRQSKHGVDITREIFWECLFGNR